MEKIFPTTMGDNFIIKCTSILQRPFTTDILYLYVKNITTRMHKMQVQAKKMGSKKEKKKRFKRRGFKFGDNATHFFSRIQISPSTHQTMLHGYSKACHVNN